MDFEGWGLVDGLELALPVLTFIALASIKMSLTHPSLSAVTCLLIAALTRPPAPLFFSSTARRKSPNSSRRSPPPSTKVLSWAPDSAGASSPPAPPSRGMNGLAT